MGDCQQEFAAYGIIFHCEPRPSPDQVRGKLFRTGRGNLNIKRQE